MDLDYFGKLFLSLLVFAPGLIVVAICAFLGLLVLLEKGGVFSFLSSASARETQGHAAALEKQAPAPDHVVNGLKDALAEDAKEEHEAEEKHG